MRQKFSFRPGIALWGACYQDGWPRGAVLITPESITLRIPGRQHVHRKEDLVELRWNDWWLNARLTLISKQGDEAFLSIAELRRWQPLLAALETCGYTSTSKNQGFLHLFDGANDQTRYGLWQGV